MAWRTGRPLDASDLVVGVLGSAGAIALVTAAIGVLDEWIPVLTLGALYVFAVLLAAVAWGLAYALPVAVASMLAFNWFFLEPTHTFHLQEGENWLVLVLYLVVAVVASELAARARRTAYEAQQREREAALLAEAAASLLGGGRVADELDSIATRTAGVLRRLARLDHARGGHDAGRGLDHVPARGRRAVRRDDLDVESRTLRRTGSAAAPARSRVSARDRDRPGGARAERTRGGGAPAERCDQDHAAAGRLSRPALAPDRDRGGRGRAPASGARARRVRPGGARGDDRDRVAAARAHGRRPARPLAAADRSRDAATRALVGRRARGRRARRAPRRRHDGG